MAAADPFLVLGAGMRPFDDGVESPRMELVDTVPTTTGPRPPVCSSPPTDVRPATSDLEPVAAHPGPVEHQPKNSTPPGKAQMPELVVDLHQLTGRLRSCGGVARLVGHAEPRVFGVAR